MESDLFSEGKRYISAGRASEKFGYTADYIGQLCRAKKVNAKLIGRTWYVDFESLVQHRKNKELNSSGRGRRSKSKGTLSQEDFSRIELENFHQPVVQLDEDLEEKFVSTNPSEKLSQVRSSEIFGTEVTKKPLFTYETEEISRLPELKKIIKEVSVVDLTFVSRQAAGITLGLIFLLTSSMYALAHTDSITVRGVKGGVHEIVLQASLLDPSDGRSLDNLSLGLQSLSSFFGGLKDFALRKILFAYNVSQISLPTQSISSPKEEIESNSSIIPQTIAQVSPADTHSNDELRAELESFIIERISSLKPSSTTIYQSPVFNNVFRSEILSVDTRPAITRQADADSNRRSELFASLAVDGELTRPTLISPIFPGGITTSRGDFNSLCIAGDCKTEWPAGFDGAFDFPFDTLATGENATSTTLVLQNGFVSTASSTLTRFSFTNATGTAATTTAFFATKGNFTTLCIAGDCQTTWPSGGGSDFAFDPQSYGVSTTTTLGLLNGFISTASSTFTGGFNANKATTTSATSTNLAVTGAFNFLGTVITNVSTWFNGLFDTQLATKTTDNLTQGSTNKYYSDTLVNTYINASTTIPKTYTANTFTAAQIFDSITRSTTTNATTTNLFSTTASSTNLFSSGLTVGSNILFVSPTGNKVGIGTSTPSQALDVFGTIKVRDISNNLNIIGSLTDTGSITIGNNNTNSANSFPDSAGAIVIGNSNLNASGGDTAILLGYANQNGGGSDENTLVGNANVNGATTGENNLFGRGNTVHDDAVIAQAFGATNELSGDHTIGFGIANTVGAYSLSGAFGLSNTVSASGAWAFGSSVTNSVANSLMIGPSNTAKITILSSGNVGIGTTTPGTELSIGNTGNDTVNISAAATSTFGSGINIRTGCFSINGSCLGTGGGAVSSVSNADGSLTISPTTGAIVASLNVANANAWTALQRFTNSSSTQLSAYTSYFGGTATSTFNTSGWLGVGTTTPWGLLSVNPTSALGGAPEFVIASTSATHLLVNGAGQVGIGTGSPGRRLDVQDANSVPQLRLSQSGAVYAEIYADSSGDVRISTTGGNIRANDENLWVCSGGSCGATAPVDKGNVIVETSIIFNNNHRFKQVDASTTIMYDSAGNETLWFDEAP